MNLRRPERRYVILFMGLTISAVLFQNLTFSAPAETFDIYLAPAPKGQAANDGLSAETPLPSLMSAQKLLNAIKPDQNVRILVSPGNYYCINLKDWQYSHPKQVVELRALNPQRPPVFHGLNFDRAACQEPMEAKPSQSLLIRDLKLMDYK